MLQYGLCCVIFSPNHKIGGEKMPFKRRRPELIISHDVQVKLEQISKSRTESATRIERAKMILEYAKGDTVSGIAGKS